MPLNMPFHRVVQRSLSRLIGADRPLVLRRRIGGRRSIRDGGLASNRAGGIFASAIDWPTRALFAWAFLTSRLKFGPKNKLPGSLLNFDLSTGDGPRPYDLLSSSRTASGALTEQLKIPKDRILCFEQNRNAAGPLLALETTSYALSYGTEYLYPSTATVRAGLWRGRLAIPPAAIVVSTASKYPS